MEFLENLKFMRANFIFLLEKIWSKLIWDGVFKKVPVSSFQIFAETESWCKLILSAGSELQQQVVETC